MKHLNRFVVWLPIALFCATSLPAAGPNARLVDAVKNTDKAAIRSLLQQHADVNAPRADGSTALHWAVHWDDLETATLLIRAGARVNATTDLGVVPQAHGRVEQSLERVGGAVIAGVHENEFVLEIVLQPEGVVGRIDRLDEVLVRPGGDGHELVSDRLASLEAAGHETIEGDDEIGMFEDALVDELEDARREAGGFYFAEGEELIGVEVHGPVDGGDTSDGGGDGADQADHRR